MNMFKKITAVLCAATVLSAAIPSGGLAKDNLSAAEKSSVLSAMGIDDESVRGQATRDYLVTALSGFIYDPEEKIPAEEFARLVGITEFGQDYKGDEKITVKEALKYAVITLGYKTYAESKGDGGFESVASELGLTDGVTVSGDYITADGCRQIMYNMLEAEPMTTTLNNEQIEYNVETDETLLSKYRSIYYIYGTMTANEITSLNEEEGAVDGYIEIDGTEYRADDYCNNENLLGKDVEAYIQTDKYNDAVCLYAGERADKNSEISVSTKDVEYVAEDFSQIEYAVGDKTRKAKLSNVPKVIYNGVFYGDYTTDDFKAETGNIRLLDNNSDGKYDVIFIYSYETVVLGAIDLPDKTLYNKFNIDGYIYSIDLDEDDLRYTITDGEKEIAISDLNTGDILSIAKSKSETNKLLTIYVSEETEKGNLTGLNEENKEIEIDGETYAITADFIRFKKDEAKEASIGSTYKYYLDVFGNVVYWEMQAEDGYAVIYKFYEGEDDFKYYVTYMNMDGEWIDAPISEKLTYDDMKYKSAEIAYEDLMNVRGKVVKIKVNSAGEVKKIETPTESGKSQPSKFVCTPAATYIWRTSVKSFDCKYYTKDDAKLIIIPEDVKDKQLYAITTPSGYFMSDGSYMVSVYDFDNFGFSSLVSMTYKAQVKNTIFMVTEVSKTCNSDGEVVGRLVGSAGDFNNLTMLGCNETVFDSVEPGDVIKVGFNSLGYVDVVSRLARMGESFNPLSVSTPYGGNVYMAGTVLDVDAADNKVLIDFGDTTYAFKMSSTVSVKEYNSKSSKVSQSSAYNIVPGDDVFIHMTWGMIYNMIVRK